MRKVLALAMSLIVSGIPALAQQQAEESPSVGSVIITVTCMKKISRVTCPTEELSVRISRSEPDTRIVKTQIQRVEKFYSGKVESLPSGHYFVEIYGVEGWTASSYWQGVEIYADQSVESSITLNELPPPSRKSKFFGKVLNVVMGGIAAGFAAYFMWVIGMEK